MSLLDARKKAAAKKQADDKPAGALGALKSKRVNGTGKPAGALAALKKKKSGPPLARLAKRRAASSKLDFTLNGVQYHNCRMLGRRGDRPWGSVDITNGDKTWTVHNRYGSWMVGDPASEGVMHEPATLQVGSQLEVCRNLIARFDDELKSRGIPTAAQLRAEREEQERREAKKREGAEKAAATRKANKENKQDD